MPPAGWYPAEHADGELRYWDGAIWYDDPAPTSEPATAPVLTPTRRASAGRFAFFRRPTTRRTAAIAAGAAFLLGTVIGFGGGAGDPATITALEDRIEVLQTEHTEAMDLVADREAVDTAKDAAEGRADALADEVEATQAELASVEGELASAQAELSAVRSELDGVRTERDAQQARVAELEAAAAPAPVVEQPSAPVNVHYQNCAAARAAGAAPVYSSDPGYGRHLDRDGDGVGCE